MRRLGFRHFHDFIFTSAIVEKNGDVLHNIGDKVDREQYTRLRVRGMYRRKVIGATNCPWTAMKLAKKGMSIKKINELLDIDEGMAIMMARRGLDLSVNVEPEEKVVEDVVEPEDGDSVVESDSQGLESDAIESDSQEEAQEEIDAVDVESEEEVEPVAEEPLAEELPQELSYRHKSGPMFEIIDQDGNVLDTVKGKQAAIEACE